MCSTKSKIRTASGMARLPLAPSRLSKLAADDPAERHALPRAPAQVVRQPQLGILDLPLAGLAAKLQPHFEEHPQPRGADGMPERFQAAVRVDRQLAAQLERAVQHVLP